MAKAAKKAAPKKAAKKAAPKKAASIKITKKSRKGGPDHASARCN